MRNEKGQFVKGYGFWTGKKRKGLKTSTTFSKDNIPWNKGKSGYKLNTNRKGKRFNTGKTHFKKGQIPWSKGRDYTQPKLQGENHPNWKGGIIQDPSGYIKVLNTDYENRKSHYKRQHRKIMEAYIGKELSPEEVVHHINGIKDDNRIENLKIMSFEEHSRWHRLNNISLTN